MLSRLEARDQELFGSAAFIPVHTGRSGGIGARGEYVALPDPGNQRYARAQFDLKYLYGIIRVSGPSMAKTGSEAGAFVQALRSELDGIRNDLKKDVARQVYGNGDGSIALTTANSALNVLVLQASGAQAINKGQLYVGQYVDIGAAATPQGDASNRTITAVNAATPSITVDGAAVTTSNGDLVSRAGANTANATYEITGMQQLVATSANTVGGINASTSAFWDNLRDTAGTAISHDRLMQMFNQVRIAGGEVSLIISSFGVQRDFYNTFQTNVRYVEPLTLKGGFQTLEFMGKPLVADVDAPYNRVYCLDERFLKVFSNRDWHFLDDDNSVLKWDTNFDAWKAVLARYMNLGISRRNVQGVITTNNTVGY